MIDEVIWCSRAEADLLRAYSIREGVGAEGRFLELVTASVDLLQGMPSMAPIFSEPYRRLVVPRLRIGLFYSIEGNRIIVQALCELSSSKEAIYRHLDIRSGD